MTSSKIRPHISNVDGHPPCANFSRLNFHLGLSLHFGITSLISRLRTPLALLAPLLRLSRRIRGRLGTCEPLQATVSYHLAPFSVLPMLKNIKLCFSLMHITETILPQTLAKCALVACPPRTQVEARTSYLSMPILPLSPSEFLEPSHVCSWFTSSVEVF